MTDLPAALPDTEWKNLFGVCGCIAEDFGFNPLWLRLAFAAPLIWAPLAVLSTYAALGVIVLASRLIFPTRKRGKVVAAAPVIVAQPEQEFRLAA
ncbi:PspC domain-containing protein [Microvirga sp. SRT01]|uniref:PspC domain-containing protein n=1 Tax=Sphingomonas longa TaxID=2778730 RepID=A0ABS2D3T2_9SPHN|nr:MULTISPECIES: PspC domain-containing protein [Alphaproteobacteria]MBM6575548.1 PspC domain-containing protein [Sphingomonas sp. BT552]MBR7708596.1 PspC domain-containing protein [Microvirga sp. SRT01]